MDFILVVILFFIFLSLVGNSWVVFIIARRRRLQTTSNWFILSLAAADLVFAFFFVNVSAIGLIAMVAERYVAIVHSLKYVRLFTTTRRTFIIIGTCWGFPFLFTVLRHAMYLADGRHSVKSHIAEVIYIFLFCNGTDSASLDSTFSYPTNCSQTFSANENSHETS